MATNRRAPIQTFVIFDLEGTGLPSRPTDYPVRIMELSMVAVHRPPGGGGGGGGSGAGGYEDAFTAITSATIAPLPPEERGFTTPKRPIRLDDALGALGTARGRARPRLTEPGTPPEAEVAAVSVYSPLPSPPRIRNSLLLAVSPRKQISVEVTEITDLDNDLLAPHAYFDPGLAELLRLYLARLPSPVCLVAHNGNRYDFPLLKAELRHTGVAWLDTTAIVCADTLSYFRAVEAGCDGAESTDSQRTEAAAADALDGAIYPLDSTTLSCGHDAAHDACLVCNPGMFLAFDECDTNAEYEFTRVGGRRAIRCLHAEPGRCVVCEHVPMYRGRGRPPARRQLFAGEKRRGRGPSLKLPDVYERRFGLPPERSHCAADDVEALMLLCLSHGDRFFGWADRNCTRLADVEEMWVRRRGEAQRAA